jgi:hypothetical protein
MHGIVNITSLDVALGIPEQLTSNSVQGGAFSVEADTQHPVSSGFEQSVDLASSQYGIIAATLRFQDEAPKSMTHSYNGERGSERENGQYDRDPNLKESHIFQATPTRIHLTLDRSLQFPGRALQRLVRREAA